MSAVQTNAGRAYVEQVLTAKAAEITGKKPRKPKKVWEAPVLADFHWGHVLSFDQTFTNTGWCHLYFSGTTLTILRKGTIKEVPVPTLSGQEDTLQRSTWMAERIATVVRECSNDVMNYGDMVVVHERPAVGGHRIESSLLGALGVWMAMAAWGNQKPVIVSNTHMRAVMTGLPREGAKSLITQAVNRYTDTKGWNADQRDALALGLTYLYDRKKAADAPRG